MTIQEEILSLIGKLDYNWYTDVEKAFKAEDGYDPVTKKVCRIVPDYHTYYDFGNGNAEPYDWEVSCGIEEYAWDYRCIEYPWISEQNASESKIIEEPGLPFQGKTIADGVLKIISDNIDESEDIIQQDRFITKVLATVIQNLKERKTKHNNDDYSLTLTHFYSSFRAQVSAEYRYIRKKADKRRSFLSFIDEQPVQDSDETNYNNDEKNIRITLKPLSGFWKGTEIMRAEDFESLIVNTIKFIDNKGDTIPGSVPIRTSGVSKEFIRYTFDLLSREGLNGKITKGKWAVFLKHSFNIFATVDAETIRKKMADKPPKYDFDLKHTITYQ